MLVRAVLLLASVLLIVEAASPDPPKAGPATITTIGSKKLATAADCSKPIAFSGTHVTFDDENRLIPSQLLLDEGVGYSGSTGIFTTHCPGLYLFSFAGYTGDGKDLRLTLKRRVVSGSWQPVASAGPSGGSNTVLLRMAVGDQVSVFSNLKGFEEASFSGYRFAKE